MSEHYPTSKEITETFTVEELDLVYEVLVDSFYKQDVEIAEFKLPSYSPSMIRMWANLVETIQDGMPGVEIKAKGFKVTRSPDTEEKRDQAISWLRSKLHSEPEWDIAEALREA